jgi:hypothetical protein
MIEELASVVLTTDLPERGLQAGDIGTVVLVHQRGQRHTVATRGTGGLCYTRCQAVEE